VPLAPVPTCLVVSWEGVYVPHRDGWHEAKLGRLAPLGPLRRPATSGAPAGRSLGPSTYCIGLEATQAFWPRLLRAAWRYGLGRGVRQVVLLGDGGEWLWTGGRALRLPGVQVIEILHFYHASEYLADVARLVFPTGPVRQQTWLAAVRHRRRRPGPHRPGLFHHPCAAHGLSPLRRPGLAPRLRPGGTRVQACGPAAPGAGRRALGPARQPAGRHLAGA
jgi:hypothetical protein